MRLNSLKEKRNFFEKIEAKSGEKRHLKMACVTGVMTNKCW